MMIIMGKVYKMEVSDNGDQVLSIKVGHCENMISAYMHIYFKGPAPFQLNEEVEVCFKKKEKDNEPSELVSSVDSSRAGSLAD